MKLNILHEDTHLLAINKPTGVAVQTDKTGDRPLMDIVQRYLQKGKRKKAFIGLVHRLDRRTSGVVLFAKTPNTLAALNEQFRQQKIQKIYWAVVKNKPVPEKGILTHYLVKNQQKNKSKAFKQPHKYGKKASLHYQCHRSSDRYYLLEIEPISGRHHQIRAQLSAIGCPIKGDVKYGFSRTNRDGSIHLHAHRLTFLHPFTQKKIDIIATVPANNTLWNVLSASPELA